MLDRVLAKLFKAGLLGVRVLAQENSHVADIHVEGQVLDLLTRLVGRIHSGDMDVLLEFAGGNEIGDELEVGCADDGVGPEGQFFDRDIKNDTLVECLDNMAECFHEKITGKRLPGHVKTKS